MEVMSVTRFSGGIADNVIPGEATARINYRYAPGRSPQDAEARLREICEPHGSVEILSNGPSGPVPQGNPLVDRLRAAGQLALEPKQAWTPVAEFGQAGVDAVNFGPGDPAHAHQGAELVRIAALERCLGVLERFACA
jgi:succinyl-diaminopimelate desuccinylase